MKKEENGYFIFHPVTLVSDGFRGPREEAGCRPCCAGKSGKATVTFIFSRFDPVTVFFVHLCIVSIAQIFPFEKLHL